MIIKGDRERESFCFERFTSWKETDIFGLIGIGKHLKLDKKLIRFNVLIGILSIISIFLISNHYFI